jgi:hypothetical protein
MTRISHYLVGVAAIASVWATSGEAEENLGLFSSQHHELAFAINNVCMPYMRQGGAIAALAGPSGVSSELDGRPAVRLHGFGRVKVAVDPSSHGCVIVAHDGDGRVARDAALKVLEAGYLLETLVGPNEQVLHSRKWSGLNEAYCFRLDEKVVEADIVTSRDPNAEDPGHPDALRMRLVWSDAEAVKKGVCKA